MFTFLYGVGKKFPRPARILISRLFPRLTNLVLGREQTSYHGHHSRTHSLQFSNDFPNIPNLHSEYDLAIISPFLPVKSGIAWNSSRTATIISQKFRVYGISTFGEWDKHNFPIIPATRLKSLLEKTNVDSVLFAIGNGEHYDFSIFLLQELNIRKSFVLLHDIRISGVFSKHKIRGKKSPLGLHILAGKVDNIIVHSEYAKNMIANDPLGANFSVSVLKVGVPVENTNLPSRKYPERKVIGTAGFFDHSKSPEKVFELFILWAKEFSDIDFSWIGWLPSTIEDRFKKKWSNHHLDINRLHFTGYVDDETLRECMSTLFVSIQLRESTNGESSGISAELASVGTPSFTSEIGAHAELPSSIFNFVPSDVLLLDLFKQVKSFLGLPEKEWIKLSKALQSWANEKNFYAYSRELLQLIGLE